MLGSEQPRDNEHCEIRFDGAGTFYLRESPSSYAQNAYPGGHDPSDHPAKEVTWYGAASGIPLGDGVVRCKK